MDSNNYWNYFFFCSVSRIVLQFLFLQTLSRNPDSDGICKRHSDVQVSFSIRRTLYNDVFYSCNLCYLYYYGESFLLCKIMELGSCLEIHYLTLDCWLASLIMLKRNWILSVIRFMRSVGSMTESRTMISVIGTLFVQIVLFFIFLMYLIKK